MERIDMESRQLMANNSASQGRSQGGDTGLDLHKVIESFQKRKLLLFLSVAGGLVLASLICIFMTPRFDAVTYLNIHPESSAALDLGDLAEMASGSGGLDWDAKVQTEVLIISSEPRAWDVISQLRLDQNQTFMQPGILNVISSCKIRPTPEGMPIESVSPCVRYNILQRFSKALDVEALPKSQVVELRFRSKDPKLAAEVVNHLATSYLHYNFVTRFEATMLASK